MGRWSEEVVDSTSCRRGAPPGVRKCPRTPCMVASRCWMVDRAVARMWSPMVAMLCATQSLQAAACN